MTSKSRPPEITYPKIKKVALEFSKSYKSSRDLPPLPTKKDLQKFHKIIFNEFKDLVEDIRKHFESVNADVNNGIEHSVWVAERAGYIAERECVNKNITSSEKVDLIRKAILAGLLHDIDRHLGFGESHMIAGEKTARRLLSKFNLNSEAVFLTVRNHDNPNYHPNDGEELKIVFGSVFDADHLRYGLEREKNFWEMKQRLGVKPEDVIHDYKWLYEFLDAWKTGFGKKVCRKYLKYALSIAEHVENKFEKY